MKYKYGEFTSNQISSTAKELRKEIFFLLLIADPKTKEEYVHINVNDAFEGLMIKLDGMNRILFNPPAMVTVISLLEEAKLLYNTAPFDFQKYRKLILDSGNVILRINEKEGA